jgi:thioredoxin 1
MASPNVVEFTDANWDHEVSKSPIPVLVDFWAPWCGPCRQLSPTIERIADNYAGRIKVGKLNIDDSQEVAAKYRISTIPRLLIFKGGEQPVKMITGNVHESVITKDIDSVLAG